MKIINTDQISRIGVSPEKKTSYYRWSDAQPAKYFLGFKTREAKPAGWGEYPEKIITTEQIMSSSLSHRLVHRPEFLESESIFDKASVYLELKNKTYDTIYFNSTKEAESFAREVAERFPHIIVE